MAFLKNLLIVVGDYDPLNLTVYNSTSVDNSSTAIWHDSWDTIECHYSTPIGSHTLRVDRYHRRAAMITGSARNRILVHLTLALGDAAITRIRVLL